MTRDSTARTCRTFPIGVELCVDTASGDEVGMGSTFDDLTLVENQHRSVALPPMSLLFALAETADATDYDQTLLPIAIGIGVIALASAAITAWIVTPAGNHN